MIGLVIISIFTATVTTSLTAISLSNEIKLYGSDVSSVDDTLICFKYVVSVVMCRVTSHTYSFFCQVVALKNTEEQRFGVRNNAKVHGKSFMLLF